MQVVDEFLKFARCSKGSKHVTSLFKHIDENYTSFASILVTIILETRGIIALTIILIATDCYLVVLLTTLARETKITLNLAQFHSWYN